MPEAPRYFSPLQHYPGFRDEDVAIFEAFRAPNLVAEDGFIVDFLGARTRCSSLATGQRAFGGRVLDIPVPGDYHAEAIEYIGLLKSVLAARGRYAVLELGAGWGPWLVAGALAARRHGIADIRLVGVEADPQHYDFMRQHLADNGIDPDSHTLLKAAVGTEPGRARWPKIQDAANDWGSRPAKMTGDTADVRDSNYLGGLLDDYIDVEIIDVADVLTRQPCWDVVHIDVQGWELSLCTRAMPLLRDRARFVILGTHSRKLDGDLYELFHRHGWVLEHEKPTQMVYTAGAKELESMNVADGTQVWRNPTLSA